MLVDLKGLVVEALGEVEILINADAILVHPAKVPQRLGRLQALASCLVTRGCVLWGSHGSKSCKIVIAGFDEGVDVVLLCTPSPVD